MIQPGTDGTPESLAWPVSDELAGWRVDAAVARLVPDLSRTQAARLAAEGCVRVNDQLSRGSRRLRAADRLSLSLPDRAPAAAEAEPIPLRIVYQDDAILVVDKAAGLVVHPAPGHPSGTLVNALLAHDPGLSVGPAHRLGLVHRLDRDTSGLIVVARTDAALRDLQAQWARRETTKVYLALVFGRPKVERATIEAPIGRDPRDRKRMALVANGRAATTTYRVLEGVGEYTLVEATILTGRTHQIRVHLASIGHPIVGDPVYGRVVSGLDRQFLHAARLGFRHPVSGQPTAFESPLPDDLAAFLARLRLGMGETRIT